MSKVTTFENGAEKKRGGWIARISDAILSLVAVIPVSAESQTATPDVRAAELCEAAARTTAKISGLAAIAPGPLGLLTVLPDLIAMWRIQSQLVSDIASVYGRTGNLSKEHMLWCLFKHSAAQTFRDVAYRAGERYLIRPLSLRALNKMTTSIGVRLSERAVGKAVARFLPLVGAAAVAGYAYYDTKKVGAAAVDIFSKEPVFLGKVDPTQATILTRYVNQRTL
jgi:uncharacterized protein (DUF697 family)